MAVALLEGVEWINCRVSFLHKLFPSSKNSKLILKNNQSDEDKNSLYEVICSKELWYCDYRVVNNLYEYLIWLLRLLKNSIKILSSKEFWCYFQCIFPSILVHHTSRIKNDILIFLWNIITIIAENSDSKVKIWCTSCREVGQGMVVVC